ncbi:membrane protein, putative [Thermosipho africanus TCF52B]|jgi:hypothetical protein|uniref:Membrane protein, putative n=1 Tax=Thermosipho africanus (strain TCF52B) TaxID=484019 RepID=B7IFJ1_THEAB|nr:hypothetical protein [Thermosipho africanus]ACJ74855.1 membrane protein, putative [Thermosipho africanus TCF52B]MDK2840227.1 hypothetical protein [Thermosipho sp. (in: thermotogales)]
MIHLFLGHYVADHGFTHNSKLRHLKGWKLIEHLIWSVFAILAFTFDTLLKDAPVILFTFIAIHLVLDFLRTKVKKESFYHLIEISGIILALIFNYSVYKYFYTSYLSREFVLYLLGMALVTTALSYFFRNFYPKDEMFEDLEGISERLAFFVFFLANKPFFAFLSLLLGFMYRLWKVKKFDHVWWISPAFAVVFSMIWKVIVF